MHGVFCIDSLDVNGSFLVASQQDGKVGFPIGGKFPFLSHEFPI
jgi:hypothetical protein